MYQAKSLNTEVLNHFGLARDPFRIASSESDVFTGGQFNVVVNAILENIENRGLCTALIAPRGSGKSTLLDYLITLLNRNRHTNASKIRLITPQAVVKEKITARTIYESIVYDLSEEENPKIPMKLENLARKSLNLFRTKADQRERCCLLIDDAHQVHINTLSYLKNFLEIKDGFTRYLSVILLGQEPLFHKINNNEILFDLKIRTNFLYLHPGNTTFDITTPDDGKEPLTPDFVEAYLAHRFKSIGADVHKVIDKEVFALIAANSCETVKDVENKVALALEDLFYRNQPRLTAALLKNME